jgi:hypothetical protein
MGYEFNVNDQRYTQFGANLFEHPEDPTDIERRNLNVASSIESLYCTLKKSIFHVLESQTMESIRKNWFSEWLLLGAHLLVLINKLLISPRADNS